MTWLIKDKQMIRPKLIEHKDINQKNRNNNNKRNKPLNLVLIGKNKVKHLEQFYKPAEVNNLCLVNKMP